MVNRTKKLMKKMMSMLRSSLGIIVVAAILLEIISAVQYYYTRGLLEKELEARAETELLAKRSLLNNTVSATGQMLKDHLWDIGQQLPHADSIGNAMMRIVASNPVVAGSCMPFVPYYYPEKGKLFEPYAFRKGGQLVVEQIANEEHNYLENPAFVAAWRENRDLWSDPYEFQGDSLMYLSTYTHPYRDAKGEVVAVLGIDISLDWLNDTLNTHHLFPSSFNLLLDANGEFITGPGGIRHRSPVVDRIVKLINDSTVEKRMSSSGRSRVIRFDDDRDAYIFCTSQTISPHWQIAVVCYEDEVYEKLYQMRFWIFMLMLAGLVLLGFIINRFAMGEKRLRASIVEKERMGSELRVASGIQKAMMGDEWNEDITSKEGNPWPGVMIRGSQVPAKEVGGDLFYFRVRDEKLFFCIGDVSGKGIPAALVMAVTHAMFRACSTHESTPDRIMRTINEALCQNNKTNMFVTLFIGVLDLPTGRLRYCNAGHDSPLLIGSEVSKLPAKANLPVGVFADIEYTSQETLLAPATTMFLYTDGLTEARNAERKQLGLPRVLSALERGRKQGLTAPEQWLSEMSGEVSRFVEDAEQSDDLTMLVLRYDPVAEDEYVLSEDITLKNQMSEVSRLNDFVKMVGERLQLDKSLVKKLRLAVEEVVVNVISYAYLEETEGNVVVSARADKKRLSFVITDWGFAFAPTDAPRADISQPVEERAIGGLGIMLVRQLMDSVNYERVDGKNILTMRKNL